MRTFFSLRAFLFLLLLSLPASAEETSMSATELSGQLAAAVQDGSSVARVKFKVKPAGGAAPTVLQLQIKARRTADQSEVAYEVLWPTERKGERLVLRQRGNGPVEAATLVPPDKRQRLTSGQMLDPVLGSDLAAQDAVENFFRWKQQTLDGREKIGNADCIKLESRPGAGDSSPYGKVVSWIDPRKMIPLRIEKFDKSGNLVRRIATTQTAKDDRGRNVPAAMTVTRAGGGSVTEIDGSNLRHDVTLGDADFAGL
jgi:hypothetical protein